MTPAWFVDALAQTAGLTYPQYLLRRSREVPERVALVYREQRWTYAELLAGVHHAAHVLRARYGVRPGNRVVMNVENSDGYVLAYLGVLSAGAAVVPVNPKLSPPELAYILDDAAPVLYLHDGAGANAAAGGRALRRAAVHDVVSRAPADAPEPAAIPVAAPAAVFYTSGTTGRPKGVVHSHATLVAAALQAAHAWGYARDGLTNLAITPLFHIASHSWAYPTLAHAGTLVIDSYGTEKVFGLIERHRVQGFGCVPAMLMMMLQSGQRAAYDLGSVLNVRFGASPIAPDRLAEIARLFPNASLYHGMGQTESGGTISVLPGELAIARAGSTGFALAGCEVRIVDDEDRDVPPGHPGEVLARGPNVMLGYLNRPRETAETLRGGWLHTGDVGYRDAQGHIYLVDRKKDMIIRGGENIYSVEVEHVLLCHDAVHGCAVVGVPDEVLGERVCAVIATDAARAQTELTEQLRALCASRLASFKVPESFLYLEELPRTATGKIQKAVLREMAAQRRPLLT